jgi:uroporphyrinogen decarboxylase
MTGTVSKKPLYADPAKFGDAVADDFGVTWSTSHIDRGSPIGPCLAAPTLKGYTFPDPTRPGRFEGLTEWSRKHAGHYRIIWVGDLWERATFMRGMASILMDVVLEPAFVEALLERLTEYILATIGVLVDTCAFEAIAVSDDYGTQRGMLISPDDWRRVIKPCLKRIYGLAKHHKRTVFHHSCGSIVPIIGDLIDIGLDILHPIQPEAMDIRDLKRRFGAHVTFCGGIPTQTLLVNAAPEEVRAEVRRLKREMGRGGGYILEPGITILADVPAANIIAMIDEARERDS